MAIQLVGVGVTLPSVGVSLTPTTTQMPWSGESLLGIGVSLTSAAGSSVIAVYSPTWPYFGF